MAGGMHDIEIDIGRHGKVTGFRQVVPADPADATTSRPSVPGNAQPAIADTAGAKNDSAYSVGVMVLAADLFLEPFGDPV